MKLVAMELTVRKGLLLDCSAKDNRKEGRLGLTDEAYTVRSLSCLVDPLAWS